MKPIERTPLDQLKDYEQAFVESIQKREGKDFWGISWQRVYGEFLYVSAWWGEPELQAHILVVERIDDYKTLPYFHYLLSAVASQWNLSRWPDDMNSAMEIAELASCHDAFGLAVPKGNIGNSVSEIYGEKTNLWHIALELITTKPVTAK